LSQRRPIRPSIDQVNRAASRKPIPSAACPVLREYQAVIHGQLTTVKVYGKPPLDTPLPKASKVPEWVGRVYWGVDPETIPGRK